jgi:hypothetical protein
MSCKPEDVAISVLSVIVAILAGILVVIGVANVTSSTRDIQDAKCQENKMHILYSNTDGSVGWYHTDVPCGKVEKDAQEI